MPWQVEEGNAGCGAGQFAVVKIDDGEVVACHASEADAQAHVAALYANEQQQDTMNSAPVKPARKPHPFCYRAVEFRATSNDGDGLTLEGYAAVFDTPTRIEGYEGNFDEQMKRGAFRRTLNARTPVLQFDHGMDARTGSVPIGKINDIFEDDRGLFVSARLFDNPVVEPIQQAIAGGAIDGMSFRFRVIEDRWERRKDDVDLRTIEQVDLFELGPVVFPAYEATTVGVRSLLAHLPHQERVELVTLIAREVRGDSAPVDPDTAAEPTEPVQQDTSGLQPGQRRRRLDRSLRKAYEDGAQARGD
jgi:Escherichia/Staphylococcus phage prohead protease